MATVLGAAHFGFCYLFVIVFDLGIRGASLALTVNYVLGKQVFNETTLRVLSDHHLHHQV